MYTHGPVNYEYVLPVTSIYGLQCNCTAKERMDSWTWDEICSGTCYVITSGIGWQMEKEHVETIYKTRKKNLMWRSLEMKAVQQFCAVGRTIKQHSNNYVIFANLTEGAQIIISIP